MQKQKMGKAKLLITAALLCPTCALAQIGGGNSGSGAHGSSTGAGTTTGIASDQVPSHGRPGEHRGEDEEVDEPLGGEGDREHDEDDHEDGRLGQAGRAQP